MTELKQQKLKNDYETVANKISSSTDYKGLQTLANNIRVRISKDTDYKHFVRLADNAEHKSKVVRILEKCPSPSNDTLLEQIAFNNFVQGCAVLDKAPSSRVIHWQLNRLGYAKTMAKQNFTTMFTTKTKECVFTTTLQQGKQRRNGVVGRVITPTQ